VKKNHLAELRQALITVLLAVVGLRIILWAIEPFIPLIVGLVIVVSVLGVLIYRTTRF
jgi:hypothetical protein